MTMVAKSATYPREMLRLPARTGLSGAEDKIPTALDFAG